MLSKMVALCAAERFRASGKSSWADDHGAGVVQAVRLKTNIGDKILEFVAQGNLVLGICNGFQALVNLGLLPGFNQDYTQRSVGIQMLQNAVDYIRTN